MKESIYFQLVTPLAKLIIDVYKDKLKGKKKTFEANLDEISYSLIRHIKYVKNWSSQVSFRDVKTAKLTNKIFVELDLFIYQRSIRYAADEKIKSIPIKSIFEYSPHHIVLLGQPGAGKTTSMKYFCQQIFFDEEFAQDLFDIPILIRLRDFNTFKPKEDTAGVLIEYLFNLLGLQMDYSNQSNESIIKTKERIVLGVLDKLKALIIIDGFDELGVKTTRNTLVSEIARLASYLESSRLIVTSRTGDYSYDFENISVYELCPLNEEQITIFAEKWLENEFQALDFVEAVLSSPFSDTAIRPLTIAHLCAIFERVGRIPEFPKAVYRKTINLLLEEWDEQRNIKRISNYSSFEADRKLDFLVRLSYFLTTRTSNTVFTHNQMVEACEEINPDFDLSIEEISNVIKEIESHTGLFLNSGYQKFEFAHKSLQEYLTAEFVVRLPTIPTDTRILEKLPNELAIAVSISSDPSLYFVELTNQLYKKGSLKMAFFHIFISRLILEKPEFNLNPVVGIAALKLYSAYIRRIIQSPTGQLNIFVQDRLLNEFELLIDQVFKRNTRDLINGIYINKGQVGASYKDGLVELTKNPNLTLDRRGISRRMPTILFVRESFL